MKGVHVQQQNLQVPCHDVPGSPIVGNTNEDFYATPPQEIRPYEGIINHHWFPLIRPY